MSPRLLRLVVPALVTFVVVLVLNLILGNGILPGLVIGLVAAVLLVGIEALAARRQGKTNHNDG